jgi:hypothetical protein
MQRSCSSVQTSAAQHAQHRTSPGKTRRLCLQRGVRRTLGVLLLLLPFGSRQCVMHRR